MKRIVFGECVQGASHKRIEKECQDSMKRVELDEGTVILAVADGHGSDSCPFSKSGSSIAVNVFCKVMSGFYEGYKDNLEMLLTFLNREGDTKVAQAVDSEWKRRVLAAHTKQKRDIPVTEDGDKDKAKIFKQYGSTLVGLMITPIFVFAFQLGDGDITYIDNEGVEQVLVTEKILGTETHSLSKIESWKKAISAVRRKDVAEQLPAMFMLSTDGFSNSYKNEAEFKKTCEDYFAMVKQHGTKAVDDNLKVWLTETSEQGCGDDITVLMAYFCEDEAVSEKPVADKPIVEDVVEDSDDANNASDEIESVDETPTNEESEGEPSGESK